MTSAVSKFVLQKVLKEQVSNNQGRDDPYFEQVPTRKLTSFSGATKLRKRRKALPPGLSTQDEKTLVKVKRRAYRLDMALGTCCGIKIGWGSVIGIFPGIGDVIDALLAVMVIRTACEAQIPEALRARMMVNVMFDFAIGLVPFVGDLADCWYKCNTRNAVLLEDYLRKRGAANLKAQGVENVVDPSLGDVEEEPEGGVVDQQPGGQRSGMTYGATGPGARAGAGADYDAEAGRMHGDRGGSRKGKGSKREREGGRQGGSGSKKMKGHSKVPSQETGTTATR